MHISEKCCIFAVENIRYNIINPLNLKIMVNYISPCLYQIITLSDVEGSRPLDIRECALGRASAIDY